MVGIIIFMLALISVYVLKAVAIIRTHDDIVMASGFFNWMRTRTYEEVIESAEATAAEFKEVADPAFQMPTFRMAQHA